MSFGQFDQPDGELVAHANHRFPPLAHSLQILLALGALDDHPVHREQFRLKLACLFMERRAEVGRNRGQAPLKRSQRPARYLQQVRLPQAFVHGWDITPIDQAIQGRIQVA